MPRMPRVQFQGAYYHIHNRGVEKRSIYFTDYDRNRFLSLLDQSAKENKVDLFAYCLMENHFHFFLRTNQANLDKFMQKIQSQYAQYFNKKYKRVGGLFQGRYKSHLINKDSYSLTVLRYIHLNPVEAGHNIDQYPWSSYLIYLENYPKPDYLQTNWILQQFHSTDKQMALRLFHNFHEGSDPC